MSLNREVKRQLAEAFGLKAESDVDALLASLRDDKDVDPAIMRKGCRALLESLLETRSAWGLGFWVWDVAGGTVFFDAVLCGMLGLEETGALRPSANLATWMHADDRADFHRATVQALKGEVPLFHVKHRVRHTAGHWIW